MARSNKYITIEGQYAGDVLGTFRVIRGFANLKTLAQISTPFPLIMPAADFDPIQGYQRTVDHNHALGIKNYLQDGKTRFIPEIILSIRATFRDEVGDAGRTVGVISDDTPGLVIKRRWKSKNIRTHQIILEREKLIDLVRDQQIIRRIDGNHRLHLAHELQDDPAVQTKYLAPFCAILLAPPGDRNDDYVESMLFHTVNSTALPLDSEHALQLILGQNQQYRPTADEEFATSPSLYLTRILKNKVDVLPKPIRERLGETPATVLNKAARTMINTNVSFQQSRTEVDSCASALCAAFTDILARLPSTQPELCKAEFFLELATLAWEETSTETEYDRRINQAVKTLEEIGRWLGRDGFHQIRIKPSIGQQLFEIFQTVRNRAPKRLFLSRWYPSATDGNELQKANLRKEMIERALDDLRVEGIDIALDDPGTEAGSTFPIRKRMYEAIAQNDIILVDISGVRANVCVEAGYALERHRSERLLFIFQSTEQTENNPKFSDPPFDLSDFRYDRIGDTAEIIEKIKPHIRTIWQEASKG